VYKRQAQRPFAYDEGSHLGENAFVLLGKSPVEFSSDDAIQDGVSDELQPFIVLSLTGMFPSVGTVGKGLGEKFRILEIISYSIFDF